MPWDPNLGSRPSYLSSPNFIDLSLCAQIEKLIHKLMCFWNICVLTVSSFSFERLSLSLVTHPIFSLQSTVQSPISLICRHLIKPVLQQIRLLQVAWITTSDWLKLRGSHKYTQEWPTCCKTGFPWAGKSCNMYRFPARWRTALYFLQRGFATCNYSMKCIDDRFCSLSSLFLVADPRIRFRAWKALESWASCKENGRCSERVTVERFVRENKGGAVKHESTRLPPVWPALSLLLVLSLAPRGFSPGSPVFPSP